MITPILLFLLGLCVGSFLNVTIFRISEGKSIVRGRSKCMKCEEPIDVKDLVPLLSYLALRGRCRKCKTSISWQYPVIELATGVLFVVFYLVEFGHPEMVMLLVRDYILIGFLIVIFVYDLRHMLILDKFTIPAMIFALIINLWLGIIPGWSLLTGGLVLAAFFYIQFVISNGTWVGGGDIRMGALIGFILGLEHGLVALFMAYFFGALVGVGLMLAKKIDRKAPIPFGTFLSIATLVMLLAGDPIVGWYLSLFN